MKFILCIIALIAGIFIGSIRFNDSDRSGEAPDNPGDLPRGSMDGPSSKTFADNTAKADELSSPVIVALFEALDSRSPLTETIEALRLIPHMTADELVLALEASAGKETSSAHRDFIIKQLFQSLMKRDFDKAQEFYLVNNHHKQLFRSLLYGEGSERSLAERVRDLDKLKSSPEYYPTRQLAIESLLATSPADAFQLLESLEDQSPHNYEKVFVEWAMRDPDTALKQLDQMPEGYVRSTALEGYAAGLAKIDPNRAAEFAESFDHISRRKSVTKAVAESLISYDVPAALDYMFSLEDPSMRNDILRANLHLYDDKEPLLAFDYAQKHLHGKARYRMNERLIRITAMEDINTALTMVEQLPYGAAYRTAVFDIAKEWAEKDPEAAFNWASTLEEGIGRERAINAALGNMIDQQPEKVMQHYEQLENSNQKNALAYEVVSSIRTSENGGEEAALRWINSLPEANIRNRQSGYLIQSWLDCDFSGAMRYLNERGDPAEISRHARTIGFHFVDIDPTEAAKWAISLQDGGGRNKAVDTVALNWVERDSYEASQWIATLKPGTPRDKAVTRMVEQIREKDPLAAFAWAETVGDNKSRKRLATESIEQLKKNGQIEEARQTIAGSDLSEAEKRQLFERLEDAE